jgi:hypothetical protein
MLKFCSRFPYYVRSSIWLVLGFAQAAWFFKHHAHEMLELPQGTQLDNKQLRRLKHYFYGTTYLSFLFSMLRGSTRTHAEKYRFVNLSALAYHFDDLADAWRVKQANHLNWQGTIKEYGAHADQSGLALHLLNNVEQSLPAPDFARFQGYMERVFRVETDGRQITDAHLQATELLRITREKGGCSVLMFRTMQSNQFDANEEAAWYQFGGLIQLCDDIFDIWFDKQEGVSTLATNISTSADLALLRDTFEAEVNATFQTLMSCNQRYTYRRTQLLSSWYGMHYIIALTRLCLKHYEGLIAQHGHLPVEHRQTLVLDMEKWSNRKNAMLICLQITKP